MLSTLLSRAVIVVTHTSSIAVKTLRVSGDNSIKILDILPSPQQPFFPSLTILTIVTWYGLVSWSFWCSVLWGVLSIRQRVIFWGFSSSRRIRVVEPWDQILTPILLHVGGERSIRDISWIKIHICLPCGRENWGNCSQLKRSSFGTERYMPENKKKLK